MNYKVFSELDFTLLLLLFVGISANELHDRLKKLGFRLLTKFGEPYHK